MSFALYFQRGCFEHTCAEPGAAVPPQQAGPSCLIHCCRSPSPQRPWLDPFLYRPYSWRSHMSVILLKFLPMVFSTCDTIPVGQHTCVSARVRTTEKAEYRTHPHRALLLEWGPDLIALVRAAGRRPMLASATWTALGVDLVAQVSELASTVLRARKRRGGRERGLLIHISVPLCSRGTVV